ncbi:hypothetical protein UFOVP747_42 [uncultured Caudovirales phage]|uniref:Uncharacterized protein n=1 Tax=uncultured Caudovirales phage TaxID=2100421 RepID=A0A6J7X4P6_9CAUD|nr:hypothetical protein UFOVP675_57 [uncultured Caudovirales phage]CAB5225530.1 hypothetical protein UFOVP747_42 [uncultured Caudovirales phage]
MNPDVIRLILEKAANLREAQAFIEHISATPPVVPPSEPAPVVVPSKPEPPRKRKRAPNLLAKSGGNRWPDDHLAIIRQCKTDADIAAAAELFGRTPDAVKRQLWRGAKGAVS